MDKIRKPVKKQLLCFAKWDKNKINNTKNFCKIRKIKKRINKNQINKNQINKNQINKNQMNKKQKKQSANGYNLKTMTL